ncbi:MAG: oleandomycin transport system permease protein [Actinomycetota bacterium]|nr:oleandomycin transport system permease protein [Actinomycetota bacterium]
MNSNVTSRPAPGITADTVDTTGTMDAAGSTGTASVSLPGGPSPFAWARQTWILAGRSVKKMFRHPEQFFDAIVQPVLFLVVFVYVLGGAMSGSTHDYLQYVLPGVLIQTVLLSTVSIGVNLNTDIKEGMFDRLKSLPISRSAPLTGAVLCEGIRYGLTIVITLLTGAAMGYRTTTGPVNLLAACLLVLAFAWCLCWITIWLGMVSRQAGSVQSFGFLALIPLTFGSSMFADADTMPGPLRTWVEINPVSTLTDAVRNLLTGGPVAHDALLALGTGGGILLVFAPLAVRAYRTRT